MLKNMLVSPPSSWNLHSVVNLGSPHTIRVVVATAKSLQSCPTLCDTIDSSPLGFPVPGILQARTLEWVAISFSNAWKWKVKVKSLSRVRLYLEFPRETGLTLRGAGKAGNPFQTTQGSKCRGTNIRVKRLREREFAYLFEKNTVQGDFPGGLMVKTQRV